MARLNLNVADKSAGVYLNGGYAGTADGLKSMWLEPGAYNLELRGPEGQSFQRRIYVLSGKTVRLISSFAASEPPQSQQETP